MCMHVLLWHTSFIKIKVLWSRKLTIAKLLVLRGFGAYFIWNTNSFHFLWCTKLGNSKAWVRNWSDRPLIFSVWGVDNDPFHIMQSSIKSEQPKHNDRTEYRNRFAIFHRKHFDLQSIHNTYQQIRILGTEYSCLHGHKEKQNLILKSRKKQKHTLSNVCFWKSDDQNISEITVSFA